MNSEPSVQVHGADHSELRPADISLADVTEKRAPLFVEILLEGLLFREQWRKLGLRL